MYEKTYIANLIKHFHYENALTLYRQYGQSKAILAMFERSETAFNAKKLVEFLKDLLSNFDEKPIENIKPIAQIIQAAQVIQVKELQNPAIQVSETQTYNLAKYVTAPPQIQELVKEIKRSYRIKDSLFAQLELFADDLQRCEAALEILDLAERIQEIWVILLHFDRHKAMPIVELATAKIQVAYTDIGDLYKRKATLIANISRDKKRKPEKVPDWEKELELVKEQINGFI
jgi:hypothetical protein